MRMGLGQRRSHVSRLAGNCLEASVKPPWHVPRATSPGGRVLAVNARRSQETRAIRRSPLRDGGRRIAAGHAGDREIAPTGGRGRWRGERHKHSGCRGAVAAPARYNETQCTRAGGAMPPDTRAIGRSPLRGKRAAQCRSDTRAIGRSPLRNDRQNPIPHSSFLIPHSSFLIPHSSLLTPHSSLVFLIPHSYSSSLSAPLPAAQARSPSAARRPRTRSPAARAWRRAPAQRRRRSGSRTRG